LKIKSITLFGSSQPKEGSHLYTLAYNIGKTFAKHRIELINGGYTGIMEASAKGAREAGGRVTGVTVKTFSYARPNAYLTQEIKANDLFERLSILISKADGYIVLPGSTGTLVELSLVWEFFNKGASDKFALIDSFWSGIREILPHSALKGTLLKKGNTPPLAFKQKLIFCEDLLEALENFLAAPEAN